MPNWRPPVREPGPVHAALHDYVRTRAAETFLREGPASRPLGRADMVMDNGRTLRVELRITPLELMVFGTRDALVFELGGHAAEASTGYEVTGRIVLDRETLAFLSIEALPSVVTQR